MLLWFRHVCSADGTLLEHERCHGLGMCFRHACSGDSMLLEHKRYYGLGMYALVIACIRTWTLFRFGAECADNRMHLNMDVILVWAWMLWSPYVLGTR